MRTLYPKEATDFSLERTVMSNVLERTRDASRLGLKVISWASFLAPVLTRLLVGYAFYLTGKGKVGNLEGITEFFTSLSIPFPAANAWFVSHLEYFGGALLMIGLATRPVAALLGATMVVALLTADRADFLMAWAGEGEKGLIDLTPVAYGMFLLWLLTYGPGLLSVDAVIRRKLGVDVPTTIEKGDSVSEPVPTAVVPRSVAV
jgi:putative oxidoreductase